MHDGFQEAYEGLREEVISAVRAYLAEYPTATIQVTGHSLGAAIATLAALDIKKQL